MRGSLISLAVVAVACVGCGGPANPVSPSPSTTAPLRLDRVVEGGGGGGLVCIPAPCPETGILRVDAGDADLSGQTQINQSSVSPFEFSARYTLILLAGHVEGGSATIEVSKPTMAVSLSLVGPNGETLEMSGEAEATQTLRDNTSCASKSELVTDATFIFRYIGRTVITDIHCFPE